MARDESDAAEYERGHLAGEVNARLAGHDTHFAAINGHLARMEQTLAAQQRMLAAQQRDIQLLLAAIVKPPLLSPVQRIFAEMAGLAAFAAFASWILSVFRR